MPVDGQALTDQHWQPCVFTYSNIYIDCDFSEGCCGVGYRSHDPCDGNRRRSIGRVGRLCAGADRRRGSILAVPLLVYFVGVRSAHIAIGTSAIAVAGSALTNLYGHAWDGRVKWPCDFWAPWCGPCRAMTPIFERAASELEPQARLVKVNVDEEPELAARLGVRGIPALFVVRHGKVVAQQA